jgi:hypothetical protein
MVKFLGTERAIEWRDSKNTIPKIYSKLGAINGDKPCRLQINLH